jgi:HEPN domain-containing protein
MREEARDWYDAALNDLKMADSALEAGLNNWAMFAAHQAVEKALKALIIAKQRERPPKTHDLVELLQHAGIQLDKRIETVLAELSPYYSVARYPNAGLRRPWERINRETAVRMVEAAKSLVKAVGEKLGTA